MGSIAKLPTFSPECQVSTPPPAGSDTTKYFSRWSHMNVTGLPAYVIVPITEGDVISAIQFAKDNGYKLIPASGTHGPFVPIDEQTVYLDMRKFDAIHLDEEAGTVKLGGGALTGSVLRGLGARGWYTNVSNSNEVGMVGYILGGGSSIFNGLHGLAMDIVQHVRIITAAGKILELTPSSIGEEAELFNVLGGAGYGFGVVTSITIQAWRIHDLGMTEDKLSKQQLIFGANEIHAAAELFSRLLSPPPDTAASLVCLRAPAHAPQPGAPMAMIFVNSLGPSEKVPITMPAAFEEKYTSKAFMVNTGLVNWNDMNNYADVYNRHGDYKENHGVWSNNITAEAIVKAFESWIKLGEDAPSAKGSSSWVVAAKNPSGMLSHDKDGNKFFPRTLRDKSIYTRIGPWWTDRKDEDRSRSWAREMIKILGPTNGEKVCGYGANLNKGIDMGEVYHPHQLEHNRQLQKTWDPSRLFWNPVTDGV